MDETGFREVVPGTEVHFALSFYNDSVPQGETDAAYRARIVVRGDNTALLDERRVVVIVPRKKSTLVIK